MKAKPDLVPDCDVHGEPMYRDECPAPALGLEGTRDVIVWRCGRYGCGRYFYGTVGYRYCPPLGGAGVPTPHCTGEGAFLVVQRRLGSYICPVAGCAMVQAWQGSHRALADTLSPVRTAQPLGEPITLAAAARAGFRPARPSDVS